MAMNQVQFQSGLSMAATRATIAPCHDPLRPLRRAEPASGDQLSWLMRCAPSASADRETDRKEHRETER
jgi:hypothetical protein